MQINVIDKIVISLTLILERARFYLISFKEISFLPLLNIFKSLTFFQWTEDLVNSVTDFTVATTWEAPHERFVVKFFWWE